MFKLELLTLPCADVAAFFSILSSVLVNDHFSIHIQLWEVAMQYSKYGIFSAISIMSIGWWLVAHWAYWAVTTYDCQLLPVVCDRPSTW